MPNAQNKPVTVKPQEPSFQDVMKARRTIMEGKRGKIPQADVLAAARIVNVQENRMRIGHLKLQGYTEEEAKAIVYAAP